MQFSLLTSLVRLLPGIGLPEFFVVGMTSLVYLAVIGAIFFTAYKVSKLSAMHVCPHCGAKL